MVKEPNTSEAKPSNRIDATSEEMTAKKFTNMMRNIYRANSLYNSVIILKRKLIFRYIILKLLTSKN